ncbi:adenylyl-sulfate kinase [Ensifer adhaerens]|uniref:adenylyl-sulfate kinase n=1 Tax=Ensifer adhaerens TaxID=106592 RepID=UPI001F1EEE23|nr:adenylyl-sulfate kinase [Ensifer adhaerens]
MANEVAVRLRADGRPLVMLDGDELRAVFGAVAATDTNHGRQGRLALAMQYARLCQLIGAQGISVVIATISLFHEVHEWNRANLPGYFEAYLKVPLEELRRRDPKGIYRRFDEGTLSSVAGLDLPVDEPTAPDWTAEFTPDRGAAALATELISELQKRKLT